MSATTCRSPLTWDTLLDYWLGELDSDHAASVEEHYLGCGQCSHRLAQLVSMARAVRAVARQGGVTFVINEHFLRRLTDNKLRVREYRVPCNGAVNCTVAPGDHYVVACLEAPLESVQRLDIVTIGAEIGWEMRQEDIPFHPDSGHVLVAERMDQLRALPATTVCMRLLAIDDKGERTLGEYTFHHSPFTPTR